MLTSQYLTGQNKILRYCDLLEVFLVMTKKLKKTIVSLIAVTLSTSSILGIASHANQNLGAKIYCTMRQGGNDHETSWLAAYETIKSERGGLIKTSPRKAASKIIEQVIGGGKEFSNCVQYLGQLYGGDRISNPNSQKTSEKGKSNFKKSQEIKKGERYTY